MATFFQHCRTINFVCNFHYIIFNSKFFYSNSSLKGTPIDEDGLYESLFLQVELPFATSKSIYPKDEIGIHLVQIVKKNFNLF
jgi:hypothetical protein